MAWTWNYTLTNGEQNDADEVMSDLNQISAILDGGITQAMLSGAFALTAGQHGDLSGTATTMHTFSSIADTISAAQHGDLSGTTTTMHTAEAVAIADAGSKYVADDVEAALTEIAAFTGLGGGATGGISRIGSDYEASTAYSNCSVVIPANSGVNGIRVHFQLDIKGSGALLQEVFVPLRVNATTLSVFGTKDSRFHLLANDQSPAPGYQNQVGFSEINGTNYPALDMTISNTVSFGMPWEDGAGADWSANAKNYKIMVDVF